MKPLVLAAMLFVGNANALYLDGNDLLHRLNSDEPLLQMVALGYIMGVSDATKGRAHCVPHNVTSGQTRDMVRNYLNNNPAERHFSAHSLVREVLAGVFPCAKSGGGKAL